MNMTPKQHDFLLSLLNEATGETHKHLSQHKGVIAQRWGLSSGRLQRLSKAEASKMISDMLADQQTQKTGR